SKPGSTLAITRVHDTGNQPLIISEGFLGGARAAQPLANVREESDKVIMRQQSYDNQCYPNECSES
uniref:Uncharacterized protein n=1 Tax=Romanomermis culicivorax TaxID=13658 RepID=A0A915I6V3_ROMCU